MGAGCVCGKSRSTWSRCVYVCVCVCVCGHSGQRAVGILQLIRERAEQSLGGAVSFPSPSYNSGNRGPDWTSFFQFASSISLTIVSGSRHGPVVGLSVKFLARPLYLPLLWFHRNKQDCSRTAEVAQRDKLNCCCSTAVGLTTDAAIATEKVA